MKKLLTLMLALFSTFGFSTPNSYNVEGDYIDRFLRIYAYVHNYSSTRDAFISEMLVDGETLIFKGVDNSGYPNSFNRVVKVYIIAPATTTPYETELIGYFFENEIIPIQTVRDAFKDRAYSISWRGTILSEFPE